MSLRKRKRSFFPYMKLLLKKRKSGFGSDFFQFWKSRRNERNTDVFRKATGYAYNCGYWRCGVQADFSGRQYLSAVLSQRSHHHWSVRIRLCLPANSFFICYLFFLIKGLFPFAVRFLSSYHTGFMLLLSAGYLLWCISFCSFYFRVYTMTDVCRIICIPSPSGSVWMM